MTQSGHSVLRIFAAQNDADPIPGIVNPCCNLILIGEVLALGKAMRRRDFVTAIVGSATAWPLTLRAQQSKPKPMRRVAVLLPYSANDPQVQNRNAAFLQALQQLGWTVGQNVQIDYRWSAGSEDDVRRKRHQFRAYLRVSSSLPADQR